jgi:membrane-anchored glycerophosphoryl diester phosphodiesterase (GDPDase)
MFKDFLKDSFFFTKRYYGYIFGLLVISFILGTLAVVVLLILGILLAMLMGVDMSTLGLLNDKNVFPFLSSKFIFYMILMILLFIMWVLLVLAFIQYPLVKTFIEITREKDIYKKPFEIFFAGIKEKNLMMGLKIVGLGFLLTLIVGSILFIGIIGIAFSTNTVDNLARFALIIIGIVGIVLGVYLLLRLMFANAALVDKDIGVIESIKESLKLTKGKMGFVIAAFVYSILVSIVFQIPVYIVDTLFKTETSQESVLFIILSLIGFVFYLIAVPYFIVLQYLPYNTLKSHVENANHIDSQFYGTYNNIIG